MPSLTLDIKPNTPLHAKIIDAIRSRYMASSTKMTSLHRRWKDSEERFIAYLPEREVDAQRREDRDILGEMSYRTIMLPYSYAQLMAAHTYWTTVFLGRNPIMQFSGRHGEAEQQIQAMEALVDYQIQVGEMLVPFYIWLLDVGKYGLGLIGNFWAEEFAYVSRIEETQDNFLGVIPTGPVQKRKITERVRGYHGSKIYNIRPYNWFPDPRVPLNRFQDGEFCGVYAEIGWNEIVRRKNAGAYMNIEMLKKGPSQDGTIPQGEDRDRQFSTALPNIMEAQIDPFDPAKARTAKDLADANFHGLYDWYIELIPAEWGIGKSANPEKWVFTTDSTRSFLIGARPLGALHNKFPFDILEFEPEGYALANRSMMEVLQPVQDTMDWLINAHFYNVRKTLNDQFIVDPSRVVMKDVLDPQPGGIFRLKSSAYGSDVGTVIKQLPVTDVTRAHINDIETMNQFGQRISGVNDQIMGQVNVGGRRTATEVRTSTTFGINRLKTVSEYFSAGGFAPLSQKLVQNSQQYYDGEQKFRLVGDLANEAGGKFVDINPDAITGFYDFVPVDGTLPIDRFAQANLWRGLFSEIQRVPAVAQQFDIGRIFAWVAQLAGLKNINQFRVQVVPDAQAADLAQSGNVVGLPAGGPGADLNSLNTGQVPNVGATG